MSHSISSPTQLNRPLLRALPSIHEEERRIYDADFLAQQEPARREAFTMIPSVVRSLNDGYAVAVFEAIARHANANGEAWPSVATICELTGWSKKIVLPAIQRLINAGAILKERRQLNGMDQSNLYRIPANVQVSPTEPAVVPTVTLGGSHGDSGCHPQNHELEPLELETKKKREATPKPKETLIPDDFDLSPDRLDYAMAKGLSNTEADELLEEMRGWSLAKGGKYLNWDAAWQNWVRRRAKDLATRRPAVTNGAWVPSHV